LRRTVAILFPARAHAGIAGGLNALEVVVLEGTADNEIRRLAH